MKPNNRFLASPRTIAFGVLALLTLGLLAGCVLTSVYPYYTAKDLIFEPKLTGRWADLNKPGATNEFWEFARPGTNAAYTLTVQDGDKPTTYRAHLFRLKDWTFLDVLPTEAGDSVPPHYLLKVTQFEPTLKMAVLDYKWVSELLAKQPGALRHLLVEGEPGESDGGRLVITADTVVLQKFILKHAGDTNAFPESMNFVRQP